MDGRFQILIWIGLLSMTPRSGAEEYREEVERSFSLRSLGQFQVINRRGGVSVQGWPLDKIRVRAEKVVQASSPEAAQRAFKTVGFRLTDQGSLELAALYGRKMSFRRKILEQKNPLGVVNLEVWAPYNLNLKVWAKQGSVTVRDWKSDVEVRSDSGEVEMNGVSGETISVGCVRCEVSLSDIEADSMRVRAGDLPVSIFGVRAGGVFAQTGKGDIRAGNVRGEQVYVTDSGLIRGRSLRGDVRFQSESGDVQVVESFGSVSGKTRLGSIRLEMRGWRNGVDSFLESVEGAIVAFLPADFSGILSLRSKNSTATTGFPYRLSNSSDAYGPQPIDRLRATVRGGGALFSVFSELGKIDIRPIQ